MKMATTAAITTIIIIIITTIIAITTIAATIDLTSKQTAADRPPSALRAFSASGETGKP